ncbi:hypothetical protein GJ744_010393 [Endocarpon pusillum]|uniref:Uncharacterized protein n=1 Tax=Endocarpon pusillum TaxID=364733 RepID=A0A8H7E2Y7_9EURO|nr:hypothetical protein GJ744_010393 [Endocarpon pusillum]
MQSVIQRTKAFLTPSTSSTNVSKSSSAQPSPPSTPASSLSSSPYIFPPVSSDSTDDPNCLHDCSTCTIHYPSKWSIDESDAIYGHIRGWATHLLIATGKTDWVRDIADEKGSVMRAVGKHGTDLENGRCMVSACNMPVPDYDCHGRRDGEIIGNRLKNEEGQTEVLVLPKWEIVEDVRPSSIREFLEGYVARQASSMSPISVDPSSKPTKDGEEHNRTAQNASSQPPSIPSLSPTASDSSSFPSQVQQYRTTKFKTRPCPHAYLILLCSQKTRDARCGQSAPLLRREFERHLRPLGLYRDIHDERPGGVGIYFISHVGGHKYAANVMVYRRSGSELEEKDDNGTTAGEDMDEETSLARNLTEKAVIEKSAASTGEAMQCIWLARVRPEDCEAIIKYTVLQGKVVKPERQLRGGFDRAKGLTSW